MTGSEPEPANLLLVARLVAAADTDAAKVVLASLQHTKGPEEPGYPQ